ncbi:KdsC family phosphatase [Petrocella sp. FN5]|uniref:KdsC family phosphatase n=1 Tax=Petrocella sp. FN5 TaxID=3032002 RepID=UPI0023D9FC91|nr:HAD-IIIA family hydrolase [Petrocella sp. FN5]MDF1616138.1 HAD-IIIA family hydrolase [Petrocella sp. FN5]
MRIKILVMDVDGTLTDGKIYIGSEGEMLKAFNVKDGLGISKLRSLNIIPAIITGRESEILKRRSEELKIEELYQGEENKIEKLKELVERYRCSLAEVAYIGDDENDLQCMRESGFTGCPADAVDAVKKEVDYICNKSGGEGAVREFIEQIILQI